MYNSILGYSYLGQLSKRPTSLETIEKWTKNRKTWWLKTQICVKKVAFSATFSFKHLKSQKKKKKIQEIET